MISDYFPLKDASKFNLSCFGFSGSGKTLLACGLASVLRDRGYQIIVFDPVGSWVDMSDLDFYQRLDSPTELSYPDDQSSIVYDISSMLLESQKDFVSDFCESLWTYKRRNPFQRPTIVVFEEAHLFTRYLISRSGNAIWRLASAGRNKPYEIRTWAISQRASSIDTNLVEQSELIYCGLQLGENNLRKVRSFFGREYLDAVQGLKTGQFLMRYGKDVKLVQVPKFERQSEPIDIEERNTVYSHEKPIPLSVINQVLSAFS